MDEKKDFGKFATVIAGIRAEYGEEAVRGKEGMDLWWEIFQPYPVDVFSKAVYNYMQTPQKGHYRPHIADIKEQIALLTVPPVDYSEVYDKVRYYVKHYGFYRFDEVQEVASDLELEMIKRFGWESLNDGSIKFSDNTFRAQFRDICNSINSQAQYQAIGLAQKSPVAHCITAKNPKALPMNEADWDYVTETGEQELSRDVQDLLSDFYKKNKNKAVTA